MSGHSKWSTIKHKKALADQRRGKIFSKIVRQIQVAARKDPNPETNSALRLAIEKAKEVNMPRENIERAIKKARGQGKEGRLEEITLEAYGPSGVAFLIEALTDNKNRTLSEIKHLIEKNQGHLAQKGSVLWLFRKKAILKIPSEPWNENLELELIDLGLEDVKEKKEAILLLAAPQKEGLLKEALAKRGIKLISQEFDWQPQSPLRLSKKEVKRVEKLLALLEERDDIKGVYTNLG